MALQSLTLREYLDNPKLLPYQSIPVLFSKYDDLTLLFKGLTPFSKWKTLKRLTVFLLQTDSVDFYTINLDKSLKPRAYMNDDGRIFISIGLLLTRSITTLLSVYLHEFSHIYMSKQQNYSQLKILQREFRQGFSKFDNCEISSPIESFADVITLEFLRQLYSAIDNDKLKIKLLRLIKNREEKLCVIYNELNNYKINAIK